MHPVKIIILTTLAIPMAMLGCDTSSESKYRADGFVAVFQSEPDAKDENYNASDRNFEQSIYTATQSGKSGWIQQSIGVSRLSAAMCKGDDQSVLDRYLDVSGRVSSGSESDLVEFQLADGSRQVARTFSVSTISMGKFSHRVEVHLVKKCKIFSIVVQGSDKSEVDSNFGKFSKSFYFE